MPTPFDFRRDLVAILPNLRGYAISLAKSEDRADDLVQETMLKAWAKQAGFTPGTNLKAWLITILRNEFYNEIRARRHGVQDPDGLLTAGLAVQPSQENALELREIGMMLSSLPKKHRDAVLLVGLAGHSYKDAARSCNCAGGTMKSRVSRARARLRTMIDGEEINCGAKSGYRQSLV